jgi:23S rRNA (guanosine2251-2'-O)-methyltransferase
MKGFRTRSRGDREGSRGPGGKDNRIETSSSDRVYGLNPVLEALRAGQRRIAQIAIANGARDERLKELVALARQMGVPVHRLPRIELDRTVASVKHQGVVATMAAARYRDADELLSALAHTAGRNHPALVLGLDGIEDPRNMGAILRTAECAGVDAVFVPERRAVGLTETVAKASAGAVEYVPVARVTNLVRLIEELKARNIWVVGSAADAALKHTEWDWKLPVAIFLGSEGTGLHRLVREKCDTLVRIPLAGKLQSLNVSVAAGVLLYEVMRQRQL